MKKILILSFLFLSFNAFGEDWNPWSSIKKNSDDYNIESIIVNSKNIGAAKIVKKIEGMGIKNFVMKRILIISFFFLSFYAFGEDWNPWSSTKKNSDDLIIKSIIVNSKNIGVARIFKENEGIENCDVSKPITAEEIEEVKKLDDKKCILWFDGTKFCVFK